ncbi:MAG: hypothetical protein JNM07_02195 [Phycisphaerae bacterium]|nr:hypothetical protein [Phycisphaerae bacterium]
MPNATTPTENPPHPHVEADYLPLASRYTAAWAELNARITARQNVILLFVPVVTAVLGAITSPMVRWELALAVPVFSVLIFSLVLMHELNIGSLHNFCSWCEAINNPEGRLPCYHHASHPWSQRTPLYRRLNDLVLATMFAAANIITGETIRVRTSGESAAAARLPEMFWVFAIGIALLVVTVPTLARRMLSLRAWSPTPLARVAGHVNGAPRASAERTGT